MMGNRGTANGTEVDAFGRMRRYFNWKPGTLRWIKRQFWKRQRRDAKADARRAEG